MEDLVIVRHFNKVKGSPIRRIALRTQPKDSTANTVYLLDLVILPLHWCDSTEYRISHGRALSQNVSFASAGVFLSKSITKFTYYFAV